MSNKETTLYFNNKEVKGICSIDMGMIPTHHYYTQLRFIKDGTLSFKYEIENSCDTFERLKNIYNKQYFQSTMNKWFCSYNIKRNYSDSKGL